MDCQRWVEKSFLNGLVHNRSLFEYNDFMKHVLTLYKYRGDAEVGRAFNSMFSKTITKSYKCIDFVIPIPLSIERLYDRGFNQCDLWLEKVPNRLSNCLVRIHHEEKQSKKTRQERINRSVKMFRVSNDDLIKGKTLLILDDLYTTGTTAYQAADALGKSGAKAVYSLTLCRS
ncbi:ComF family protein [Alkalihalobacillus sp. CinArs1]|uniref:ComF family protein n=1 Tax=Alkalihalobacillus sp. CinArs1 TaxID=2995314 RepID=UPI0022DE7B42|nr:phosphoribosyltransferase family protein [Alkalihalobacillus sp. CinArs1]